MKSILTMVALLAATMAPDATALTRTAGAASEALAEANYSIGNIADWQVKQADHVSGVSSAQQITNPAKVSYASLMDDTKEMKELKRKGIKKNSAQGQVLVSAAKDRVRRAAQAVMNDKGHCSVWKAIRSKTGVKVTDITAAVRLKLNP